MEYDLNGLGSKEFEKLVQSLATRTIGPRVSTFGAGPDGGREASWTGAAVSHGALPNWNGYGVIQAKFSEFPTSPDEGLKWMKQRITEELNKWANPQAKRSPKPDYILFATNVRLSPKPGYGKDAIRKHTGQLIADLDLPILDFRVWDRDDVSTLLDDSEEIRRRYVAFITPGDVVADLLDQQRKTDRKLARALHASAARSLLDESHVGLTQAGAMGDSRVTIADVFVDLPINRQSVVPERGFDDGPDTTEAFEDDSKRDWDILTGNAPPVLGVCSYLIQSLNVSRPSPTDNEGPRHTVLVGGPGQGKSTVTQWLSQLYRKEFLRDTPTAKSPEVDQLMTHLEGRAAVLGIPSVTARRWPFRIVLTEFADFIAAQPNSSLVHFIAEKVNYGGASSITSEDMLRWLEVYPWVLFIDGLDEVPKSSNRDQVVKALREFFIEVENAQADVISIATTRPQGYANEFSTEVYRHLTLEPLDSGTALRCARAVLDVRFSGSQSVIDKVMARLERAALDESTLRLFASPLQVTILTVLLEKLGKPPSDRWRLFDAYYKVISDREQEKSGELSELLQRYDSDIDHIHREVGYVLQQRSSEPGETSASLSKSEFEEIVRRQFRHQGHGPAEVDALIDDFTRLVTDRLVFLTYGSVDRLGFELRSLQEFMAAEFSINHPEAEVPDLLRLIATSSHWRNVLLFAVGGIFAKRAPLRAEVTLLCRELNREDPASGALLLGSDLAIDILSDGSCLSMPKYARELAELAAETVTLGDQSRIDDLTDLNDPITLEAARKWSTATSPAPKAEWFGRLMTLADLSRKHKDSTVALQNAVAKMPTDHAADAITLALASGNALLATHLTPLLWLSDPVKLLNRHWQLVWTRERDSETDERPEWVKRLVSISNWNARASAGPSVDADLSVRYTPLHMSLDSWAWVQNDAPKAADWALLCAVAEFALDPSRDSLSASLRRISGLPPRTLFQGTPWVLSACLRSARGFNGIDTITPALWRSRLTALSEAASNGLLGDHPEWIAAESHMPSDAALPDDAVRNWAEEIPDPDLPIDPSVATYGVPISGLGIQIRTFESSTQDGLEEAARAILERQETFLDASHYHTYRNVLEFIIGHHVSASHNVGESDMDENWWGWLIEMFAVDCFVELRWAPWLNSILDLDKRDIQSILEGLSRARKVIVGSTPPDQLIAEVLSLGLDAEDRWLFVRLAAQLHPMVLRRPEISDSLIPPKDPSAQWMFNDLSDALGVFRLLDDGSDNDEHRMALSRVSNGDSGPFDMSWFTKLAQEFDAENLFPVIEAMREHNPLSADRVAAIAWAKSSSVTPRAFPEL